MGGDGPRVGPARRQELEDQLEEYREEKPIQYSMLANGIDELDAALHGVRADRSYFKAKHVAQGVDGLKQKRVAQSLGMLADLGVLDAWNPGSNQPTAYDADVNEAELTTVRELLGG